MERELGRIGMSGKGGWQEGKEELRIAPSGWRNEEEKFRLDSSGGWWVLGRRKN